MIDLRLGQKYEQVCSIFATIAYLYVFVQSQSQLINLEETPEYHSVR